MTRNFTFLLISWFEGWGGAGVGGHRGEGVVGFEGFFHIKV